MKPNLSDSTCSEIKEYFRNQVYTSKHDLVWQTRSQIEEVLQNCEFVYITESGSVIHAQKYCGNAYGDPIHIE